MTLDRSATFDMDSSNLVRNNAHCDYSKEDLGDCRVQSVLQHMHPSYIDLTVSDDCLPKKGTCGHLKSVLISALNYIDLGDTSDCPLLDCAEQTVSKSPTYVDVTAYVDLTSDDWTSNSSSVTDQTSDNATCNQSVSSSFSDAVNGFQGQSSREGTSSISQNSDSSCESDVSSIQSKSKPEVKGTRAGRCVSDSKLAESKKACKKRKPSRHDLSEDWEEEDTPYEGPECEEELVRGLRDMKQTPPPGPFSREDLTWLPIRTQGGGRHYIHNVAVIPWRRLQDFREGEGQDKSYPCRFNKETVKKNKLGSLVFPRANSAAKVIK